MFLMGGGGGVRGGPQRNVRLTFLVEQIDMCGFPKIISRPPERQTEVWYKYNFGIFFHFENKWHMNEAV